MTTSSVPRRPAPAAIMAALAALAAATPTLAQQNQGCWVTREAEAGNYRPRYNSQTPSYFDQALTEGWFRALQMADGRIMAAYAGVYYVETPAPNLGMVNYQYRTFDANGGFEYQDKTCSQVSCSQNYGYGRWAGVPQQDGSIYMAVNFSDQIRQSACASFSGRLNGNVFYASDGSRWQKVR
jgi:hypothetical protein